MKQVIILFKIANTIASIQVIMKKLINYNILQATQRSMHNCVHDIIEQIMNHPRNKEMGENSGYLLKQIVILVDGNYFKPFTYLYNDNLYPIQHKCIVKGDSLHKEISAASILAKVFRDKYIKDFVQENPEYQEKYGLLSNKGYGTKAHIDGIRTRLLFVSSQVVQIKKCIVCGESHNKNAVRNTKII